MSTKSGQAQGKTREAGKLLQDLQNLSAQRYVPPQYTAIIYTGLGDKDQAFKWWNQAYDEHAVGFLIYLKVWPAADNLRSDPRFADLLRRVGLPP